MNKWTHPFEKVARERCSCGIYQMVTGAWEIVKGKGTAAHLPERLGGCRVPNHPRMYLDPQAAPPGKTHYVGDSCPGGHRKSIDHQLAPPRQEEHSRAVAEAVMEARREREIDRLAEEAGLPKPKDRIAAGAPDKAHEAPPAPENQPETTPAPPQPDLRTSRTEAPGPKNEFGTGKFAAFPHRHARKGERTTLQIARDTRRGRTEVRRYAYRLDIKPVATWGHGFIYSPEDAARLTEALMNAKVVNARRKILPKLRGHVGYHRPQHTESAIVDAPPNDENNEAGKPTTMTTHQIAKASERSGDPSQVMHLVRMKARALGIKPINKLTEPGRRGGITHLWAMADAQQLIEAVRNAYVRGAPRPQVPYTPGGPVSKLADRAERETKATPFAKWLALQMEEAGVTFAHYEKGKGITIRRQKVVEEEETYGE